VSKQSEVPSIQAILWILVKEALEYQVGVASIILSINHSLTPKT